jgi:sn-glycerol 3-phosphate transport system ATP-binding protein
VLGVRAEAARLVSPDAPGALVATADFIEELGASRVVHADFDGLPFAVAMTGTVSLKTGDRIGIAIDPEAIHLYAADTGRSVAAPAKSGNAVQHA